MKVSYDGHIHDDRYFTKDEIGDGIPSYKENGYYRYNSDSNTWNKIEYIVLDEAYDIPDDAQNDTFWWAEKEQKLYEKRNDNLYTLVIDEEVETINDLPMPEDEDVVYCLRESRHYKYRENYNSWQYSYSIDPILTEVTHKSSIDLSTIALGDIFYITSTDRIYEYNGTELVESMPKFVYVNDNDLPRRQSDKTIYRVKGGTFYIYNGSYWIEIDRPNEIPEIHYNNIDKYESRNKIVFVTRRK
jgi:hypothetical protein